MLKVYSSYFVSFLLVNLKNIENINNIILFGSAARGEAVKESDVDIFVEVKKESRKFEEQIDKIVEDFYKSREALLFKAKGIDNKINVIVGRFESYGELKKSIESNGIVLYGQYISQGVSGKKKAIIFWDRTGKNRGALLNKLYGFNVRKKSYKGLIENFGGEKIGKSSIMIPIEHRDEIIKLLKNYGVDSRVIEVYV